MLHGVVGRPGSGKTLLLYVLGLLESQDAGSIEIFGQRVPVNAEETRLALRNNVFGYVFANPCLLSGLTVAENIAMPLFRLSATDEHAAHDRIAHLLETFEIDEFGNADPTELPTEIQYRIALARALVHRPRILLLVAPACSASLFPFVRLAVEQFGITCIWSSASASLSGCFDRELTLDAGRVAAERLSLS